MVMLFFGWGPFGFLALLAPFLLMFAALRVGTALFRRLQDEPEDERPHLRGRGGFHRYAADDRVAAEPRAPFGVPSPLGMPSPLGRRSFDSRVFRLAYQNGGRVTVSQVVMETGMSLEQAEAYLDQLCDGVRVRMEVSDSGRVTYEFPELTDGRGNPGPA